MASQNGIPIPRAGAHEKGEGAMKNKTERKNNAAATEYAEVLPEGSLCGICGEEFVKRCHAPPDKELFAGCRIVIFKQKRVFGWRRKLC